TQGDVTCKRLTELKGVAKELLVVSQEKTAYLAQRLEAAVSKGPAATAVKPEAMAKATPSGPAAAPVRPAAQPRRAEQPKPWATTTEKAPWPAPTVMAALPKLQQVPQETYSAGEIRAAGRGLFGSLSAELAGVIEFAFNRYGSPNGYILGTEGGVAFLAGLRYGEGRLVTKLKGAHPVHWQGPSLGYDVGLAGSRVMFLVYNLKDIKRLYSRFLGVEGAAYLVGGAGITFHQRGDLVLAPIRTGLGLRLGANIGYLKFTREPSLNPF
ncbi:MAG TPA: DUF1134 domain-containing protein, partial [Hyphomicrobiaceae bacterium]|nr:DUF1134 domain-containing protein [Hyphomicrobiaceae bacterium]